MPLIQYLEAAKNIFFPPVCFSCSRKITKGLLCLGCYQKIEFIKPGGCRFCLEPLKSNKKGLCRECAKDPPAYSRLISIAYYKNPLINLIRSFKYKNYDFLARYLSNLIIESLKKESGLLGKYDFITSVPMHPFKHTQRGYNQAELLAKEIGKSFKMPYENDIIVEHSFKHSQATLKGTQRRDNVKNAFSAKSSVKGKKIIIVDDIFTTGATIKACACALSEKGTLDILAVTLAKTAPLSDE
ncbi:MAG: ComF family protein [Candidatus Omnitrophota bacterium]